MPSDYYICPGCGDELEVGSAGCPNCNAGDDLDFHDDGIDLDLPEDDLFDYDEFVASEFGEPKKRSQKEWFWWAVTVIVFLAFSVWAIDRCFF